MSQAEDSRSAFDRRRAGAAPSLAEDREGKFQKYDERIVEQRRASNTQEKRAERNAEQRRAWTHQSAPPATAAKVKNDAEMARLKAAAALARAEARKPAFQVTSAMLSTLGLCVKTVAEAHSEFFGFALSRESVNQAVQHRLKRGEEICIEMVEAAFQDCAKGNHLEVEYARDENGNRVRKRGDAALPPPTPYPRCIWPDEARLISEEEAETALRMDSIEARRAMGLPFERLKQQVRAGFKRGGNEDVR